MPLGSDTDRLSFSLSFRMRAALSCTFEISRGGTEDGKAGAKVGNRSGCKKPDVTRYEKFQKACLLAIKTVHFSRSKLVRLKVIFFGGGNSAGFCCQVPANPARPCKGTGLNVRSRRLLTQPLLPVHDCHLQLYVLNRYGGISPKQS